MISRLPSALFLFCVATWPFEVKTTKRPFALMSVAIALKAVVGVEVSWTVNGSGVGLAVWAETEASERPANADKRMAHKNQKTCFTDSSEITIKTQIRAD